LWRADAQSSKDELARVSIGNSSALLESQCTNNGIDGLCKDDVVTRVDEVIGLYLSVRAGDE
jgi:hypothetical protein